MMKKLLYVLMLAIPLTAFSAPSYTADYSACVDRADGETPAILDCTSVETKRQDARLNENYRKVMAGFSESEQKTLRNQQRAWIKARDKAVSQVYDEIGGQAAEIEAGSVYLQKTSERANYLGQLLRKK